MGQVNPVFSAAPQVIKLSQLKTLKLCTSNTKKTRYMSLQKGFKCTRGPRVEQFEGDLQLETFCHSSSRDSLAVDMITSGP